jgi:hypothetical protein
VTRSAWKPPTPSQRAREELIFLLHRAKAGRPPGYRHLWAVLAWLVGEHPLTEEQREWAIARIYTVLRGPGPVDVARAFDLKWARRGRPTNASRRRSSIELEKAIFMVRHEESDPKRRGASARAVQAAAEAYECERGELEKILSKRRQEATGVLRAKRESEERWEKDPRRRQLDSPGKN